MSYDCREAEDDFGMNKRPPVTSPREGAGAAVTALTPEVAEALLTAAREASHRYLSENGGAPCGRLMLLSRGMGALVALASAPPAPAPAGEGDAALSESLYLLATVADERALSCKFTPLNARALLSEFVRLRALAAALAGTRADREPICSACWAVLAPNGGVLVEPSQTGALCVYGTEVEARAAMPKGCMLARVAVIHDDAARRAGAAGGEG